MTRYASDHCLTTSLIWPLRRLLAMLRAPSPRVPSLVTFADYSGADGAAGRIEGTAGWLYAWWYCDCGQSPAAAAPVPGREELPAALRVAVAAGQRWEAGWVAMQSAQNGACAAGRGDQTRMRLPGQYVNQSRPGLPAVPGDALVVNDLIDWTDPTTGFWHVQASVGGPRQELVRVYWNVGWDQVGPVLREVTSALDAISARYALKCPLRAVDFRRVDTIVVYVEQSEWAAIEPLVEQLALALPDRLRPATPPLTRTLGPGAAWAQDQGDGLSFGESRCRALAPAVYQLVEMAAGWSDDEGLEVLLDALQAAGVDLQEPWRAVRA